MSCPAQQTYMYGVKQRHHPVLTAKDEGYLSTYSGAAHKPLRMGTITANCSGLLLRVSPLQLAQVPHRPKTIMFHRAGEQLKTPSRAKAGLLTSANDWQLEVDLGRQLKFPPRISSTRLRPDMIIISDSTKQLIILELCDGS